MLDQIGQLIRDAAVASLTAETAATARVAARLAPIRTIFAGGRRQLRFRTGAEVSDDREIRRQLGLGPELAAPDGFMGNPSRHRRYARTVVRGNLVNLNTPMAMRKIGRPGYLRLAQAEAMLSRRGRYEVRSGRANSHGYVGGRLRREIHATPPIQEGRSKWVARVDSPTPYAKFQEFGTRHNPAHPFLRPALEERRDAILRNVRNAAMTAAREAAVASQPPKSIKVTLKAEES